MMWRTPAFWDRDTLFSQALVPASTLWRGGQFLFQSFRAYRHAPYRAAVPVLCVGNLVTGGGGKTPVALALVRLMHREALWARPVFLTRGYGGTLRGSVFFEKDCRPDCRQCGDEACLLVRDAPVVVSADRAQGARVAQASGADVIVMDDGLQNQGLIKTLALAVIDGASGFGNGRPLPAGPLREPLAVGFARADGFVMVGEDQKNVRDLLPPEKPVFTAHVRLRMPSGHAKIQKWVAFAGLARPEKFRRSLEESGYDLLAFESFPDHYPYARKDLARLRAQAAAGHARLITTEKDHVRIPAEYQADVETLPMDIVFAEEDLLCGFLRERTGSGDS